MGMGGAGVATTSDSLATYWNPAGLAMHKPTGEGLSFGLGFLYGLPKLWTRTSGQPELAELLGRLHAVSREDPIK